MTLITIITDNKTITVPGLSLDTTLNRLKIKTNTTFRDTILYKVSKALSGMVPVIRKDKLRSF